MDQKIVQPRHPRGGVSVFVMDSDRFLMMRRRGSHGSGTWALLGGGVDWGETVGECAVREVLEETGVALDPASIRLGPITNDMFPEDGKHYVNVFVSAAFPIGAVPRIVEADKADAIGWFSFDSLPSPLFSPLEDFLRLGVLPPFPWREVPPSMRFPRP